MSASVLARATTSPLSYDRTIDRRRVHRAAVSEVFLTDLRTTDALLTLAAAQLPASHSFFHDHELGGTDPLLLLEVARQATIASAHELGVPSDSTLISSDFDLRLHNSRIQALMSLGNLTIESRFAWTSVRGGVPRAGRCDQRILVGGICIAEHWSAGRIMTRAQMAALRSEQRGTTPPNSADLQGAPPPDQLYPEQVRRTNAENVVISALSVTRDRVSARITPHLANRALFDHSYDHVTMQILTEAARQLHLATTTHGHHVEIHALTGRFRSFAELDSELHISSARDGRYVITQDRREVAEVTLHTRPKLAGERA